MTAGSAYPASLDLDDAVVEIAARLEREGYDTWCVGGALRDRLLQDTSSDVDLATAAPPEVVQRIFPRTVPVGLRFGTVGVLDRRGALHEVTTFRRDVSTDGRHAVVAFGASLDEDLARRDFTINAIAYHPGRHEWRDPFGGRADLARGVVRAVGDPATRFREDYLRILRGLRFAARFGFTVDPATWTAARETIDGIARLSPERVRDEWTKSLLTARSIPALVASWHAVGAVRYWLTSLRPAADLPSHPLEPRDPTVLSTLLTGAPEAEWRSLRASNAVIERARAMAAAPPAPTAATAVAARRWLAVLGREDTARDLILLARYRTGETPGWVREVEGVRERREPISRADLAIGGRELLAAGLVRGGRAGPAVGRLLDHLLDVVLDAPERNTREALLQAAREWTG